MNTITHNPPSTMQYNLGSIPVTLKGDPYSVMVKTDKHHFLLISQTLDGIRELLDGNFKTVSAYYREAALESELEFDPDDLDRMSFDIVVHFLAKYNAVRNRYNRQDNELLVFEEAMFYHSDTHDLIVRHFSRKEFPDWAPWSQALMYRGNEELRRYFGYRFRT